MLSSDWKIKHRRSHSSRDRSYQVPIENHRYNLERIQRRLEKELNKSERELQWAEENLKDTNLISKRYIANLRSKVKDDYNQLIKEKVYEVEEYLSNIYEEERRLSEEKIRDIELENERCRRETVKQVVHDRDAICEQKLALQQNFYNQLLNEQARRLRAEHSLRSFESLNISQLKDRLTRVEQSNYLLRRSIYDLMDNQQPVYKSTVYIPKFGA